MTRPGRPNPRALERHPLEEINAVFVRLERGEIDGRVVLIP